MELLEKIREAGIIGAGGAGFPTHAKLAADAEFILLNGAECEPLLRVDQQLMEFRADDVIRGFEMAGRLIGAKEAIIGIKGKHKRLIEILNAQIGTLGMSDYVKVGILPDMYPAGDEQVLVHELTGRTVPEAGLPIQVGCVVLNVETAVNIYNASMGQPVTEKYITLAGDIPNHISVKVPVGTPVIDVLKLSGIEDFSNYAVIDGGPMMGPLMGDINGYVTKKNKGYIILPKEHSLIRKKSCTKEQARKVNRSTCEQCRMCTDLCPRYLLGHSIQPHKLMRIGNYNLDDMAVKKSALLCCQCNLCEYFACPAGLHPRLNNLRFREEMMSARERYQSEKQEYQSRPAREYRKVPSKRLIARLGLMAFDCKAPFTDIKLDVKRVCIALSQCVGAPAEPVVAVGDSVKAGDMIGKIPEASLGAPVHASIDGRIISIGSGYIEIGGE